MTAEEEPSRAAGGCVLAILAAVVVAVVFAASTTAGVLSLWSAGVFALWRTARRMSASRTTPPPRGVAPESDEAARRRLKKARGATDPNGVMCIIHAPAEEEVNES
ncbi:hypothetical protein [Streptomyces capitiformicae]|uniref:Uncharacterized protein n=1 Tax=Streptomyces capitiformicae TaxID=2014920 RepID=A0A919GG14_9ACTN|nr:hypothetical protein [Streptomyces capitiformicae]GHH83807.1 hypothetical protein GCM10017771_11340 [Streptomyces capitiformicae]